MFTELGLGAKPKRSPLPSPYHRDCCTHSKRGKEGGRGRERGRAHLCAHTGGKGTRRRGHERSQIRESCGARNLLQDPPRLIEVIKVSSL